MLTRSAAHRLLPSTSIPGLHDVAHRVKRTGHQHRPRSLLNPRDRLTEIGNQGPFRMSGRPGGIAQPAAEPLDVPATRRPQSVRS